MVRELAHMTQNAKPTAFHHLLASLAHEGRLMRLYSQNVDCIETSMKPLATNVPLNARGPWPVTVQLHGGLEKMVCTLCGQLDPFDGALFDGPEPPSCPQCLEHDNVRTMHANKRSHGVGRLRPRIVLYNEYNPDEEAIGNVTKADLRRVPDAVIVVGTSMKIPGLRRIVKEMCQVTRSRRDGFTAWINLDPEPQGAEFKDCWDLVVRGKSDDVAELASIPRWDEQEIGEAWKLSEEAAPSPSAEFNIVLEAKSPPTQPEVVQAKDEPLEAKSKLVEQMQAGIPTPGASPKMRTALPDKLSKGSKQSKLSFVGQKEPAAPKSSKPRKPRQSKKAERPSASLLQAFKTSKGAATALPAGVKTPASAASEAGSSEASSPHAPLDSSPGYSGGLPPLRDLPAHSLAKRACPGESGEAADAPTYVQSSPVQG
jgi:NAD+-dependent protein deacetylase SIR2